MTAHQVLGYAVATRPDGITVEMVYTGAIMDTAEAAAAYATEPGDFVVAVCEVTA